MADQSQPTKPKRGYGRGKIPYGYRRLYDQYTADQIDVEIDPSEAVIVQRMQALNRQGMSLNAIARMFNEEGIPPPRGARWYAMTIKLILDNEALYRGAPQGEAGERWPVILDAS